MSDVLLLTVVYRNSWRMLLIVVKMLIHLHMLTLQHHNLWNHDRWSGLTYASTTLMQKIMILKKCEHANTKMFISHGDVNTPTWHLNILLDDAADVIFKDHPSHWRCHLESSTRKSQRSLQWRIIRLRATKTSSKTWMLWFITYFLGWPPLGGDC